MVIGFGLKKMTTFSINVLGPNIKIHATHLGNFSKKERKMEHVNYDANFGPFGPFLDMLSRFYASFSAPFTGLESVVLPQN